MQTTYTTQARTNTQKAVSVALWLAKALWSTTRVVAYVLYAFVMAILTIAIAISRNSSNHSGSINTYHDREFTGSQEYYGSFSDHPQD